MFEPTPKQTLILWDVLARGGSAAQAEMPFKVEPKDREALVRAGVVTVKGWALLVAYRGGAGLELGQ
ncbi:MAG: hypothetical protein JOZ40_02765 [Methylobacteriaceae bacterium]|nr:hypothetical protein [Methylobacteriaceae bacterium]